MTFKGRELRSTITRDGKLVLSLEDVVTADPGIDEIVVRVQAAPINPSDLAALLGPADLSTLARSARDETTLTFSVPADRLKGFKGRLGQSLPVGVEGAGTVIAAGTDAAALRLGHCADYAESYGHRLWMERFWLAAPTVPEKGGSGG